MTSDDTAQDSSRKTGSSADMMLATARTATLRALVKAFLEASAERRATEPSLKHFENIAMALYAQVPDGVKIEIARALAEADQVPARLCDMIIGFAPARNVFLAGYDRTDDATLFDIAIGPDVAAARVVARRPALADDVRGALLARDDADILQALNRVPRRVPARPIAPANVAMDMDRVRIAAATALPAPRPIETVSGAPMPETLTAEIAHGDATQPETHLAAQESIHDRRKRDEDAMIETTVPADQPTGDTDGSAAAYPLAALIRSEEHDWLSSVAPATRRLIDLAASGDVHGMAAAVAETIGLGGADAAVADLARQLGSGDRDRIAFIFAALDLPNRDAVSLFLLMHGSDNREADIRAFGASHSAATPALARHHLVQDLGRLVDARGDTDPAGPPRYVGSVARPGNAVRPQAARPFGKRQDLPAPDKRSAR